MKASAQQVNRRTALIAFGAALLLIGAIAVLNPRSEGGSSPTPPSTFFATDRGAKAIYLVLQRLLPQTEQWRLPLTELQNHRKAQGATLIAMGPPASLSEAEADALDSWIKRGGQLILATSRTWGIESPHGDRTKKRETPRDYLARHNIHWRPGEGSQAVTAAEIKELGKGRIVYIPDSFAFSNATLRMTDNAVWLAARVSEWNKVTFLFLLSSPWGFACLQVALAGVIYILGYKRRFGRIVEEVPEERTSPIEAAEALGGLFRTAQARSLSARSIHQHLNLELSRLLGHRVDLLNPESRARVARRSNMSAQDLDAYAADVTKTLQQPGARDEDLVRIARKATNILRSLDHGSASTRRHAAVS
jgi:hypothetical protein